ncbi:hypothetical protein GIB67_038664 [Kingdonia uniflora]|uniref:non-specific serine/threonine protein kinase n=1 Tax=Kingdonia uniflora TaxID=39325 RepID=A0A7J7N2U3_9MAGN|nr:hypothetical protein GIB67_038664 [Kingdonia uniflora]
MKLYRLPFFPYSFFIFYIFFFVNVKCEKELEISSVKYDIVRTDLINKIMTIRRKDILDDLCLSKPVNTTLDSSPFQLPLDNSNITLFYGCPPVARGLTCGNDTNNGLYYQTGATGSDQRAPEQFTSFSECATSIVIPAFSTVIATQIENLIQFPPVISALNEVINGGFSVTYEEKKKPVAKIVGIVLGSIVGASVVLACFLFYRRRRKHQTSTSSKLTSRNISSERTLSRDLEIGGSGYFQTPIFSYSELEEATNNFDEKKEVGDGGFGTVYHGKLRDGRVVAVKRLYENNCKRVEQFMNEIAILSRLRHTNLVSLYGCTSRHSRELLLVYEFVPNGTVADHLHGENVKPGTLAWPVRLSIAIESADALSYLHASDTIHRDVKTNNILLDNNFHVKVADFGLSRLFPNDVTHVSTAPQGTPGYVDPEYYHCYQLTDKSDVYSFGVVLCELISSKPAVDISRHRYDINLSNMAINKIQNHSIHELVDPNLGFETNYPVRKMITQVAELAFRCLQQDKDMRPSMVEVLEVLKGIEKHDYSMVQADEIDIPSEEYRLLKNISPSSPNSVTNPWPSNYTTPNTSV